MSHVDGLLGRLSMYRLVTLALVPTVLASFVGALTGAVGVDPWGVLASTAVAVGATAVVSAAGGRLVRRPAHLESSVITGLILALLFQPSLEPSALATVAGAGAVAGASKYLVAVRGRHVVNPAAFGALVAGVVGWPLLGTFGAFWWVATPFLLPVVAVVGLAVVLRTRHVAPVVAYLLTGVAVVLQQQVALGTAPGAALWSALAQYPLVFAATIMLTEPLTLAPRRGQQVGLAVLAALLAFVPFHLGPVSNTPELGLVVANVVAFALGQRGGVRLQVAAHTAVGGGAHEVLLRPARPVRWRPGQWVELHVPHRADGRGERRTFSIVGAPPEGPAADALAVAFTVPAEPSSFKQTLAALPVGATVHATGVGGDLLLPRSTAAPLLLVAGGIGVTPFVPMLEAGSHPDAVLVLVLRTPDAPPYLERLVATGVRTLVVGPSATGPDAPAGGTGWELPDGWHRLGARLTAEDLAEAVPDADQRRAYASGSPAMLAGTVPVLRAVGVRRVRRDVFSGYTGGRRRPVARGRAGAQGQTEVTTRATL